MKGIGFYPARMNQTHAKICKEQFNRREDPAKISRELQVIYGELGTQEADPHDAEPSKEEKEKIKVLLQRLHRAGGHPNNRNLARICKDRGYPAWVIREALDLKCPACAAVDTGNKMVVPVATDVKAKPWEMIAMDVFELIFPKERKKSRYLL